MLGVLDFGLGWFWNGGVHPAKISTLGAFAPPKSAHTVPKLILKGPGCLARFHGEPGVGTSRSQPIHVRRLIASKSTQGIAPPPHRTLEQNLPCEGRDQATLERKPNVLQSCKQVSLRFTARFAPERGPLHSKFHRGTLSTLDDLLPGGTGFDSEFSDTRSSGESWSQKRQSHSKATHQNVTEDSVLHPSRRSKLGNLKTPQNLKKSENTHFEPK